MIIFLLWIFVSPVIGYAIGKTRNCPLVGALLGLLFGPLGWLLAFLNDRREQCPQCRGRVPDGAVRCLHCGSAFEVPAGYEIKK